ncbi:Prolactin [Liparis tanakae]|uniref:Prolactin n=1 Tax=Liparis tanakae TaxID=230148 RepID=A0A4Z2GHF4_9TELE|nr:Prolactin [Liparis tanakae]
MAHCGGTNGGKLFTTVPIALTLSALCSAVLYMAAACGAIHISDLLDRASQRSDKLHSLSTTLTQDLVSVLKHVRPALSSPMASGAELRYTRYS